MLTDSQRAALATRLRRGRQDAPAQIPRRPADLAELPASPGQEQLWFVDKLAPGLPAYNIPHALALSGPLDQAALGRAVDALVARHEALRTRLVTGGSGHPVQVIDPPASSPLHLTADLSALGPRQRQARLLQLVDAEATRPFRLACDCLLRTSLFRLGDAEHVLLVVVHHAVFDGWSAGILLRDLAALYGLQARGEPTGLDELPVQFADYALWECERTSELAASQLADYWQATLADLETLQFPTDRPRPAVDGFDGEIAVRMTDRGLLADVRELSRREGSTPLVTVMAALAALVHRYTGQQEVVIGTVSASRTRPELAPMIGFLVNTLPVRADLSGDPAFSTLLARVRAATTGAYAHQDLPFAQIVQAAGVERDPGRSPVFQIALSYAERDPVPVRAAGVDFTMTDLVVGVKAAKFDLDFVVEARGDGLWFECGYKTALFDAGTVRRLLAHLEVLLRGAVASPASRLSALPVLTEPELHRELVEWNDTAAVIPAACAHERFQAQVRRTPDAVAAEYCRELVSYAALNRQANQIARRLRAAGVGPEVLVGVCMRAGIRRLAALLAIWKAGGGYVPLDPALPADRLAFMIADTAMPVVITDQHGEDAVPGTASARVLSLDSSWAQVSGLADDDLAGTGVGPSNVAYVIYTSGSTGRPKGVVVEHRQAVNFLHGMVRHWRVGPSDAVLAFASVSFDASVQEMFMPLLAGGRVVLAPTRVLHSPRRLASLIRDRAVTFAVLTPAVVSLLSDEQFPSLRVLMCGGEAMPAELVGRWLRPGLRFVNDYGPTETTVTAAFLELDSATPLPPPIGLPSRPNYRAYVLDPHLNPVPVGVTGELHVGGAGVARGYLGRPELTARRFIPDPFTPGERLYQTGDLVRRRPDGTIVYLGRIDSQVKIRGLRVELGEIETALASHPAVAQAVVTVRADAAEEPQLVGYLRPVGAGAADGAPDEAELREYLSRSLPGYMVPARLIALTEFPLTTSGKVDQGALPEPPASAPPEHEAPATGTEAVLAQLFGAVLSQGPVGVTASFFHVGGNSLQAMRLVDLVGAKLGAQIDVADIFARPTPRLLAASIDASRGGTRASRRAGPVIDLTCGPGELPIFLIHPVGGTVFGYAQLAAELSGVLRVYGFQAPALTRPGTTAASFPDLADDYARQVLATQPAGPYRLAGWSMGGVVAFEVARRLERADAEVCLLALLDSPFAIPDDGPTSDPDLAGQFLADVVASLGLDPAGLPDPTVTSAEDQLGWLAERLGTDPSTRQLSRRLEVFGAHTRMLAGYRPSGPPVSAPTLIISASQSPNAPASRQWPALLGGPARTIRLNSDHYGFLRPPLVAEVASAILRQRGPESSTTAGQPRHSGGEGARMALASYRGSARQRRNQRGGSGRDRWQASGPTGMNSVTAQALSCDGALTADVVAGQE